MSKNNLITITIGIAARNEEQNIGQLLKKLQTQKRSNFKLEKIILISDESSDETVSIAKSFNKKLPIKILTNKHRLGKSGTMRKIFHLTTSEILIMLDADIIPANNYSLQNIVKPFIADDNTGMVCGRLYPVTPKSRIGLAVKTSYDAYTETSHSISNGNNVFSVKGGAMAIRSALIKQINLPSEVHCDDSYLYFFTKSKKQNFKLSKSAGFYFNLPENIHDQIKQYHRYSSSPDTLVKHFGQTVLTDFNMPKLLFIKSLLKQLLNHPLNTILLFIINSFARINLILGNHSISALWASPLSTKNTIK